MNEEQIQEAAEPPVEGAEREYEVCVIVNARAYITVAARSEADAIRDAEDEWSPTQLEDFMVADVQVEREPGVYS